MVGWVGTKSGVCLGLMRCVPNGIRRLAPAGIWRQSSSAPYTLSVCARNG